MRDGVGLAHLAQDHSAEVFRLVCSFVGDREVVTALAGVSKGLRKALRGFPVRLDCISAGPLTLSDLIMNENAQSLLSSYTVRGIHIDMQGCSLSALHAVSPLALDKVEVLRAVNVGLGGRQAVEPLRRVLEDCLCLRRLSIDFSGELLDDEDAVIDVAYTLQGSVCLLEFFSTNLLSLPGVAQQELRLAWFAGLYELRTSRRAVLGCLRSMFSHCTTANVAHQEAEAEAADGGDGGGGGGGGGGSAHWQSAESGAGQGWPLQVLNGALEIALMHGQSGTGSVESLLWALSLALRFFPDDLAASASSLRLGFGPHRAEPSRNLAQVLETPEDGAMEGWGEQSSDIPLRLGRLEQELHLAWASDDLHWTRRSSSWTSPRSLSSPATSATSRGRGASGSVPSLSPGETFRSRQSEVRKRLAARFRGSRPLPSHLKDVELSRGLIEGLCNTLSVQLGPGSVEGFMSQVVHNAEIGLTGELLEAFLWMLARLLRSDALVNCEAICAGCHALAGLADAMPCVLNSEQMQRSYLVDLLLQLLAPVFVQAEEPAATAHQCGFAPYDAYQRRNEDAANAARPAAAAAGGGLPMAQPDEGESDGDEYEMDEDGENCAGWANQAERPAAAPGPKPGPEGASTVTGMALRFGLAPSVLGALDALARVVQTRHNAAPVLAIVCSQSERILLGDDTLLAIARHASPEWADPRSAASESLVRACRLMCTLLALDAESSAPVFVRQPRTVALVLSCALRWVNEMRPGPAGAGGGSRLEAPFALARGIVYMHRAAPAHVEAVPGLIPFLFELAQAVPGDFKPGLINFLSNLVSTTEVDEIMDLYVALAEDVLGDDSLDADTASKVVPVMLHALCTASRTEQHFIAAHRCAIMVLDLQDDVRLIIDCLGVLHTLGKLVSRSKAKDQRAYGEVQAYAILSIRRMLERAGNLPDDVHAAVRAKADQVHRTFGLEG